MVILEKCLLYNDGIHKEQDSYSWFLVSNMDLWSGYQPNQVVLAVYIIAENLFCSNLVWFVILQESKRACPKAPWLPFDTRPPSRCS